MQFSVLAFRESVSSTLIIDAADVAEARLQVAAQGFAVITVNPVKGRILAPRRKIKFPLVQFSQSLLTLLEAGLSLVEGLDALAEREARPEFKTVIQKLLKKLYEGTTFSAALQAQSEIFPPLYVATIRANETTGSLGEAMARFIQYRSQIDIVRKRVIAASVYPSLILGVGSLVIVFLMLYVVPRFSQVFEDLGNNIPFMSRVLLQWGQVVHDHGFAVLFAMLSIPVVLAGLFRRPEMRARVGRTLMRLPRVGEYIRIFQLARFYRTLGMLLRGGIPIVPALDMVTGLLPPSLRDALLRSRQSIQEGAALSMAFDTNHLSTPVSSRMLRVGERTGQMGQMMDRIAAFHDEDVAQAIDWFIRLFEPILMIVIGGIIGVIVLLMYAPIFELAGAIQ
jgi:general secretion pathway protein F